MKTIAVIFGSRSTEHDVSIITALSSIIKPLELTKKYNVEAVYISKDGSWYWDEKLKDIALFRSVEIEDFMRRAPKVHLLFDDGLVLVKSSQFAGRKQYKKIDLVFPATHGTFGEDGRLMALLDMAGVPYVGCDFESSLISMDKVLAKTVTQAKGIQSTPWLSFSALELAKNLDEVLSRCQKLNYPLYVKPAHLGSSIGITKVEDTSQLTNALEVAAHYDDKIIVEQGVNNLIEVTLPIIGNNDPQPAFLEQPETKDSQFFDFETKYMQGGKKGKSGAKTGAQGYSKIPAELPEGLYAKAEKLGLEAYKAVGCQGIARVDMLIDSKTKEVYFNEINPLPGGLYAHNWRARGLSSIDLVEKLVGFAEDSFKEKKHKTTTFSTNYLKQF